MTRAPTKLVTIIAITLGLAGPGLGAGITRGARLASACAACHGPGGHSRGAIPKLAGMPRKRFIARMRAFKQGHKQGQHKIMDRIAPAYDNSEIDALARYFSRRPTKRPGRP